MAVYGVAITDTATPFLRRFNSAVEKKSYRKVVGAAGARALVDHFTVKQNRGSDHTSAARLNAKPSGLYADFARATNWQEREDGVQIQVNHVAARQRYLGGTIRPVNGSFLTIPANAFAYGRRAREVGIALRFMYAPDPETGRWRRALVAPNAVTRPTGKARKDGTRRERVIRPGGVYYWLVRQAVQKPDPTVLPDDAQLLTSVTDAIGGWIDERLRNEGATDG